MVSLTGRMAIRFAAVMIVLLMLALILAITASQPVAPVSDAGARSVSKADRLPLPMVTPPVAPPTAAAPPPAAAPARLVAEAPPVTVAPSAAAPKHGRDICRGKGRYYTHGGRSWRCNR